MPHNSEDRKCSSPVVITPSVKKDTAYCLVTAVQGALTVSGCFQTFQIGQFAKQLSWRLPLLTNVPFERLDPVVTVLGNPVHLLPHEYGFA